MERETKAPLTREAVEGIRRGCCQPVYRPEELIDQLAQSHELLRARLDEAEQEKEALNRLLTALQERRTPPSQDDPTGLIDRINAEIDRGKE